MVDFKNPWAKTNSKWNHGSNQVLENQFANTINSDIDKYELAILNDKLYYSCNCGWIDTNHAFKSSDRPGIGVANLWKQLVNESGIQSKSPNEDGFQVVYRQDAKIKDWLPYPGVTRKYFVKRALNESQKHQIALAILMEVSMAFEELQKFGPPFPFFGDSSFEPADLVSNLISFYHFCFPNYSQSRINELSQRLTKAQSIEIYKLYPGTFTKSKYKNRKFTPLFFSNRYCLNPKFPIEFQLINPANKGENFRDWYDLIDIYAGIPPIIGPK